MSGLRRSEKPQDPFPIVDMTLESESFESVVIPQYLKVEVPLSEARVGQVEEDISSSDDDSESPADQSEEAGDTDSHFTPGPPSSDPFPEKTPGIRFTVAQIWLLRHWRSFFPTTLTLIWLVLFMVVLNVYGIFSKVSTCDDRINPWLAERDWCAGRGKINLLEFWKGSHPDAWSASGVWGVPDIILTIALGCLFIGVIMLSGPVLRWRDQHRLRVRKLSGKRALWLSEALANTSLGTPGLRRGIRKYFNKEIVKHEPREWDMLDRLRKAPRAVGRNRFINGLWLRIRGRPELAGFASTLDTHWRRNVGMKHLDPLRFQYRNWEKRPLRFSSTPLVTLSGLTSDSLPEDNSRIEAWDNSLLIQLDLVTIQPLDLKPELSLLLDTAPWYAQDHLSLELIQLDRLTSTSHLDFLPQYSRYLRITSPDRRHDENASWGPMIIDYRNDPDERWYRPEQRTGLRKALKGLRRTEPSPFQEMDVRIVHTVSEIQGEFRSKKAPLLMTVHSSSNPRRIKNVYSIVKRTGLRKE